MWGKKQNYQIRLANSIYSWKRWEGRKCKTDGEKGLLHNLCVFRVSETQHNPQHPG